MGRRLRAPGSAEDPGVNLKEVPKLAEFCGFVFVNFDPGADGLEDYLAGACEYLEIVSQHSEAGMQILGAAASPTAPGRTGSCCRRTAPTAITRSPRTPRTSTTSRPATASS